MERKEYWAIIDNKKTHAKQVIFSMSQNKTEISKGVDYVLIIIYLILLAIGLLAIFAVTYKDGDPVLQSFFKL
ncbi:hypothetical protein KRR40_08905 [Niabella defluvii]|nr:hypothetical protein KRR40_08905 [Niabella sp. I65]